MRLCVNKSCINFNSIRWLASAAHKGKDDKEHLRVIAVIDGWGYASDGCRMHVVKDVGIENGVYKVLKDTKQEVLLETCALKPPNYLAVIPELSCLTEPLKVQVSVTDLSRNQAAVVMALARGFPAGFTVALDALLGALDIKKFDSNEFYFRWTTDARKVVLVVDYMECGVVRKAVIAGISV